MEHELIDLKIDCAPLHAHSPISASANGFVGNDFGGRRLSRAAGTSEERA
jgi:hypothetical protein